MARTLIVSDRNNSFFTANNIKVGTEIPTSGTYSKGDIVVNIGNNTANEAMWICTEAGTPGTWEVVGAGAGGGSGSIVAINNTLTVNSAVTEVSLGNLIGKISSSDKLIVHYNSTHLMEGIDYEVNSEGTRIVKLTEGSWNESGEQALFAFELFKNVESVNGNEIVVDTKLTSIVNNMMVTTPTTEVEIDVEGFDKNSDTLLVFKNGVIMVEGVDYNVNEDNTKIISINEVWNESNIEEYGMTFVVFKEVVVYDEATGGITMGMLGSDVRETINNLTETTLQHSNLLENMDGKYATKEDLENIEVDLSPYQQKTDNNLATTDKSIVGAINELFQSANNGKELIANAIGEPLNAEDTFSAMSNDINGLLSTFKTNMMNNGITVNSSDKFKSLIDKIATLADSEGKGIQYASGQIDAGMYTFANTNSTHAFSFNEPLNFTPTYLFIRIPYVRYSSTNGSGDSRNAIVSNLFNDIYDGTDWAKQLRVGCISSEGILNIKTVSSSGFVMEGDTNMRFGYSSSTGYDSDYYIDWYAFGVGEEDTTFRDSLASILQEEGVSVTEEDDMASLISKVDSEFDRKNNEIENNRGLDIISATELPATGRENQICVISDNPVDNFVITSNYSDINTNNTIYIFLGNSLDTTGIKGTNFDLVSNNITVKYYLLSVHQGDNKLDSYIYKNNQWTNATMSSFYIVEKGNCVNESYTGGFKGDWTVSNLNGTPCYVINIPDIASSSSNYLCYDNSTVNKINLSDYTTLEYTIASTMPDYSFAGRIYMFINTTRNVTTYVEELYRYWETPQPGSFTTYTIDISDITGEFYLGIAYIGRGYGQKLCVSDIRLY